MNTLLLLSFFLGIFLCFYLKYKNVIESLENCDPNKPLVYGDEAKEIYGDDVNKPSSKQCESAATNTTKKNIGNYKAQLEESSNNISSLTAKIVELEKLNSENTKYTKQFVATISDDGNSDDINAGESVDLRNNRRNAFNAAAKYDKSDYKIPGS
jgi:hypothetical protein